MMIVCRILWITGYNQILTSALPISGSTVSLGLPLLIPSRICLYILLIEIP